MYCIHCIQSMMSKLCLQNDDLYFLNFFLRFFSCCVTTNISFLMSSGRFDLILQFCFNGVSKSDHLYIINISRLIDTCINYRNLYLIKKPHLAPDNIFGHKRWFKFCFFLVIYLAILKPQKHANTVWMIGDKG